MLGLMEINLDEVSVERIMTMASNRRHAYESLGHSTSSFDYDEFRDLLHKKGIYNKDTELASVLGV